MERELGERQEIIPVDKFHYKQKLRRNKISAQFFNTYNFL